MLIGKFCSIQYGELTMCTSCVVCFFFFQILNIFFFFFFFFLQQILAQCEINDSWLVIDFLAKRGAVVQFGPVAAPPSDWVTSHQEFSEVTTAFSKNLALYKVKSDLKLANTTRNSTS
jgi:hypothetical protein